MDSQNNSGCGNSGNWNSGNWNSGHENSGDKNSGDKNSGHGNSGCGNSGDKNSGCGNSGNWNSGCENSGDKNSGDKNSGHENSGCGNSGDKNSGDENSGNWNSGDKNSGDENSGCGNSGNWNSGYGNLCNRSSGIFCTKTPQLYCFNKPSAKSWGDIDHPGFDKFFLTKWVSEREMSDQEKIEHKDFDIHKGYLKTYSWEEAWANYWRDSDEKEKQKVLNLPNFDADIFKEITGIDVNEDKANCDGKVIEIEGKKYKLQRIDNA